jgi:tetratricopeptide (TPR) repeat protein
MKKLVYLFILTCCAANLYAIGTNNNDNEIKRLDTRIDYLQNNQLNHQIEKELLKETYSSNFQTVNIVLAIILGLFSFISFYGLRDVGTLKSNYQQELEKLNSLRCNFESKMNEYEQKIKELNNNYLGVNKINEEQNNRIKVLEIQEKASSLQKQKNYSRALEYLVIGENLDPKNTVIMILKSQCYLKMNDYQNAISSYEHVLEIEDGHANAIYNLLELYLLTKQFNKYNDLKTKYPYVIEKNGSIDNFYLDLLYDFMNNISIKDKTLTFIKTLKPEKNKLSEWSFDELNYYLESKEIDDNIKVLKLYSSVVKGDIFVTDAIEQIINL